MVNNWLWLMKNGFKFGWYWWRMVNIGWHWWIYNGCIAVDVSNGYPPVSSNMASLEILVVCWEIIVPSGSLTVCYWKWPSRNSGFSHKKWMDLSIVFLLTFTKGWGEWFLEPKSWDLSWIFFSDAWGSWGWDFTTGGISPMKFATMVTIWLFNIAMENHHL